MQIKAHSVDDYLSKIPTDRYEPMTKLRGIINENLPNGFTEQLIYGMPGWVVPHSIYPAGYHVTPELPLPFLNIASQKNFIAFYHMGIYAISELLEWFVNEYPNHCKRKLDMGKSCIRFKKMDDIPYPLIEELVKKVHVQDWIDVYETNVMNHRKKK